MSRKLLVAISVIAGSTLMPYVTQAEAVAVASNAASTESNISKDAWLDGIVPLLPNLICKGFTDDAELKKRLTDIKMNFDQCVGAIPDSVNKCKQELYASIPDSIDNSSAATWGKSLGECIGKDFAIKYLVPR